MDGSTASTIVLCVALLATTVPAGAAEDPGLREENRERLTAYIDDWDPDAPATVHTEEGQQVLRADEALERVLDRLDAAGADLGELLEAPASHGGSANHTAGDLFIIELNNGGPDCSQHGAGEGGHYDTLIAETGENGVVINHVYFGTWRYVGTATSAISTGQDGHAIVLPFFQVGHAGVEVPDQHIYRDVVRYEGNSDFFCVDFAGSTFNVPFVRGTFGPVLEPIP